MAVILSMGGGDELRNWLVVMDALAHINHCVVTEKVPARYRPLKMAGASLGKCSIFVDRRGIACARFRQSVHMGTKSA